MSEQSSTILPLGQMPRPETGADLAGRLLAALSRYSTDDLTGLEGAAITATLDGPDITALGADLTGVAVTGDPQDLQDTPPEVHTRIPGTIQRAVLDAHPLRIMGVAVEVRAHAEDVPIAWLEGADDSLWLELADSANPAAAFVRVAVNQQELVEGVRAQFETALSEAGFTLSRLDVTISSSARGSVHVRALAQIRKSVLSASARFRARLTVAEDMVMTIDQIKISSANPLIAVALLFGRGHIDTSDRRIDLNAEMPPELRLVDIGLETGTDLILTARFG